MVDPGITSRHYQREPGANGADTSAQWPTLLSRMLEDLSRVIQLELQLLEAKIAPALTTMADQAIAGLIAGLVILSAGVMAGVCLLAALILLLHQWIPWWQCFGIGGLVAIACALIAFASMKVSTARALR